MQDGDATDTARSQKRETPEDADTAQEPERRVRPRETPVGAGAAAAPEPEDEDVEASGKAESNNGDDVDENEDDEEGSTVAAPPAPPPPPRTAVRHWRIRGLTDAERARQNRVNNPFDDPSSEIATPFDDPTPTGPDRWVREEFEVATGRVVSQETIEGEPPRH